MAKFVLTNVSATDLTKPTEPINTGVGFLDHMIDQFNSHAQVGVSVTVAKAETNAEGEKEDMSDKNRYSDPPDDQAELMQIVGGGLGTEIGKLLVGRRTGSGSSSSSRFCCPLDEALVECTLTLGGGGEEKGSLTEFTLPPYGIYPLPTGRTRIGQMVTSHLELFFASLVEASGLECKLVKVRGDNGHHVVESAFKAFSRALRNLLDGVSCGGGGGGGGGGSEGQAFEQLWGIESESNKASLALARTASLSRSTKETSIDINLTLDGMTGGGGGVTVHTGVSTLDTILTTLATEAKVSLSVDCNGDTYVDDHHTSEDVAIAIGQCLNRALGTKAGLNRMWCAEGIVGDAVVEVTMDLSNRPCLTSNLSLSDNDGGEEYIGEAESGGGGGGSLLSVEMFEHVLDSLVMNGQMTVHIVQVAAGKTVLETALATATAFGKALRLCVAVDPRRAGRTASSKGTLSV